LATLRKNVADFSARIEPGDLVVVYYAGHAIQVNGRNYLLPGDYTSGSNPSKDAYAAEELLRIIAAREPRLKLFILDACRDNPLNREGVGLAAMEAASLGPGTRIEFAASAGEAASDDGTFATALIEELQKPGLPVDEVFMNVRQRVMADTGRSQTPVSYTQMTFNFYFVPPEMRADQALAILTRAAESLPRGDIGQTRAIQSLIQAERSMAGMQLQGLSFTNARFSRGNFRQAELGGSDLTGAVLSHADLAQARLGFATLDAARLDGATLVRARLGFATAGCSTSDGKRICADFSGADARDSIWVGVNAQGATFLNTVLKGARFMFADLRGARFDGADLSDAYFVASDLRGASFTGATLDRTDLTGALLDERAFTAPQTQGTCELRVSPFGFAESISVLVIEEIPSSRFDGGIEHSRMMEEHYPISFFGKGLPPCGPRKTSDEEWYPIWEANGEQYVRTDISLRFTHKFLEQAGRRADVRQRIEQQFKSLGSGH
jgi:uncharacterized protein YjbI with pentapeptide repeats